MPEETQLDIVHMFRVEGLQSMSAAAYEFQYMREEVETLLPLLASAGRSLEGFGGGIATAISANIGLIGAGITAAVIILPALYNMIKQSQQAIITSFEESERAVLSSAQTFEIYERNALDAAFAALGFADVQPTAMAKVNMTARAMVATREEFELFRWAVDASGGAVKEFSDEIELAAQAADYFPEILDAIADKAASVNRSLMGGLDNMALFFSDTEQAMLAHGGEVEKIERRIARIREEIQREGLTTQLAAELDAQHILLAAAEARGESMEEAAQRSMGKMLLSQVDLMMKLGLDWETGWEMKEDVLRKFMGATETSLANAGQMMALFQRTVFEGPEGAAWQQLLTGTGGMLPSIEGADVTLPSAPEMPLDLLSDAVLAMQIALAESLKAPDITTETALIRAAQVRLFASEFGAEVPFLPMITKGQEGASVGIAGGGLFGGGGGGGGGGGVGGSGGITIIIGELHGTDEKTARQFSRTAADEMRAQGVITR